MCLTLVIIASPLSPSLKVPGARVQGKRPATAPTLGPLLLERLALLGLHIANDTALVTRLARSLKFVADWHRPAAGRTAAAAAELSKVRQMLPTCACSLPYLRDRGVTLQNCFTQTQPDRVSSAGLECILCFGLL